MAGEVTRLAIDSTADAKATIAPSILAADFSDLGAECRAVCAAGASWVHIDVMDGRFTPTITLGPAVCAALRPHITGVMDVHLMIEEPERMIGAFADAGADVLTVHAEATRHLDRTLGEIQARGVAAGVALNPATPESTLHYVLERTDLICIMTVNPGAGGQRFLQAQLEKIRAVRKLTQGRHIRIQVDGGVDESTIRSAAEAGADVFVAGTSVFKGGSAAQQSSYASRIAGLNSAAIRPS